ncbi:hypothetical protein K435DRAFT_777385, partial [Dendrothele bispora CBS 962.96]
IYMLPKPLSWSDRELSKIRCPLVWRDLGETHATISHSIRLAHVRRMSERIMLL